MKKKKAKLPYKSVSEEKIEEKLINLFSENIDFSRDVVEWSKKYIHEMKEREVTERIVISQRKEERKTEFENKKSRTREMLRDSQITNEEYNEDIKKLSLDYKDLNETIERIDWYSRLLEINDITGRIITVLEKGEMQAKRNIISSLGSNLTWNDEKLLINNKKEVDVLIEGMKSVKELYPKFEPKNYVVDTVLKEKTGSFEPAFSTMLRG